MILKKVISGGQTGADQGGLIAADDFGLETGGWIPAGFLTENGSEASLGEDFGLVETESAKYPPRTHRNVHDSTGTIRFASNFASRGEICTLNAIKDHNRPYLDIDVDIDGFPIWQTTVPIKKVADWIEENKIEVLNVAGNRESKCPGIQIFVQEYLAEVFKLLKERANEKDNT